MNEIAQIITAAGAVIIGASAEIRRWYKIFHKED